MIRHLFKLVWNRKRINGLIAVEIFLSFLVLFAIFGVGFYYLDNYLQPTGFEYENVWVLNHYPPDGATDPENIKATLTQFNQIQDALKTKAQIQSFASTDIVPYGNNTWNEYVFHGDRKIEAEFTHVRPDFFQTMNIDMVAGEWFKEVDPALQRKPAVINLMAARQLFGQENPVGQILKADKREYRVVGVMRAYAKAGELAQRVPFVIGPLVVNEETTWLPSKVVMKMSGDARVAFEEELIRELEATTTGWSFFMSRMSDMRQIKFKDTLTMLITLAVLALFMLMMVAMGLVGVLWQSVTRRTSEIGLRRAKGATKSHIIGQIMGEFLILATLAIGAGLIVSLQAPLIGQFSHVGAAVFLQSNLAAMVVIYSLITLSSLYPAWLATRVNPAEALHYE